MKIGIFGILVGSIAGILLTSVPATAVDDSVVLETVRNIPLPGRPTRMDYVDIDPKAKRLYIAHLGDGSVLAFDIARQRILKDIRDIPGVHGVIADSQSGTVFATATRTDTLVEIDGNRLRVTARVPAGHHPDGLAYDPSNERVFVSDETGRTVTVIDSRHARRIATIPMGGEVGNTRFDPVSGLVFSAVQTRDEIAVIDPGTLRIERRISVEKGCFPHGLLPDPSGRIIFVACQKERVLLGVEIENGRVAFRSGVGRDPDVLALDPVRSRIFVGSESGLVSIFVRTKSGWHKAGSQFVALRAHTVAVDPVSGLVYFPLQNIRNRPVLRVMRVLERTWG